MKQRSYFAWLATIGLILMSQAQVEADWLADFDGHSLTGSTGVDPEAADGHISFAVYENSGDWVEDLLGEMFPGIVDLDGTSVDTAAPYVYFYQVVNSDFFSGGMEHQLDSLTVDAVGGSVSSVGYLDGTIFQSGPGSSDAGNKVKLPGNPGLGDQDFVADTPGDGIFSEHTGTSVGLVSDAGAEGIGSAEIASSYVEWEFSTQLKPDEYSTVMYYTSDLSPSIKGGMLVGSLSLGDVATTSVPAPPAMALALLGAPFMVVMRRRRKAAA